MEKETRNVVIKKPVGLVLITVYTVFSGILMLLWSLQWFGAGGGEHAISSLILAAFVGLGILYLVASYGLWSFQKWGHTLAIVLYIISIPLGIPAAFLLSVHTLRLISEDMPVPTGAIFLFLAGGAIALLILWYLFKAKTRTSGRE